MKETPANWLDNISFDTVKHRSYTTDHRGVGNRRNVVWHPVEMADHGNLRFVLWQCIPLLELVGIDTALVESILVNKFHAPLESLRNAGLSLNSEYNVSKAAYYRHLKRQVRLIRIVLENLGITGELE